MKKNIKFALVATIALFAISASAAVVTTPTPPMVGGDRDAHGCIGSAGYSWNEAKQQCTRPWEDAATTTAEPRRPGTATPTMGGVGMPGSTGTARPAEKPKPAGLGLGVRQGIYASSTAPIKAMRAEVKDIRASTTAAIKDMRKEAQNVQQQTRGEIKDMRGEIKNAFGSSTPAQIKDMRQQFEAQAQAIRASTTAMRAEIRDEAQKMRLDVAHKQTDLANARITAAIDRIQTLEERTSTALDNLAAQGVNVDTARAKLADAAAKLSSARTQAAAISLAIESAFASGTPKVALDAVRPLIQTATKTLQEAHDLVAQAIASVKPGLNKPRPATTTSTTTQ